MMTLPDYWLPRPLPEVDARARAAFDAVLDEVLGGAGCPSVRYALPWPKWQFLCHLADRHGFALHGSGNPDIAVFEPRRSYDLEAFGDQTAVYAASDGLWALFFAVVDRARIASTTNSCIRVTDGAGTVHGPYYQFSVSRPALRHRSWRAGTVYLLPRDTFATQPPEVLGTTVVHVAQLASSVPVRPLAKLAVTPADFPFLAQVRAHDDERLQAYVTALHTGAPWPDDG